MGTQMLNCPCVLRQWVRTLHRLKSQSRDVHFNYTQLCICPKLCLDNIIVGYHLPAVSFQIPYQKCINSLFFTYLFIFFLGKILWFFKPSSHPEQNYTFLIVRYSPVSNYIRMPVWWDKCKKDQYQGSSHIDNRVMWLCLQESHQQTLQLPFQSYTDGF